VSQVIVIFHVVPQLVRGHLREYGLLIKLLKTLGNSRNHGFYHLLNVWVDEWGI
jgi:type IV secretory pathway VirB3-like protein